jgi:ferritin-like metal-binding protein YciE
MRSFLGHQNAAKLLAQTLSEEEAADKKLTAIGKRSVNAEAAAAGSGKD